MPKRRRKRSSGSKPPLQFEESPVHVVKTIPSPVFCTDNPVTADVVAVDDCPKNGWVSPQFEGDPTPLLRRSRSTRLRSGNVSEDRRKSISVHTTLQAKSSRKHRRGVAPLQFLGDNHKIADYNDTFDHLKINEHDAVEFTDVKPKRLEVIYSQDNGASDQQEIDLINQFDEPGDDNCAAPEPPDGVGTPHNQTQPDSHPLCPVNAILTPDFDSRPNKAVEISDDLTQRIPKTKTGRQRKKLFFGPNSDENNSHEGNHSSLGFITNDDVHNKTKGSCDTTNSDSNLVKLRSKECPEIFANLVESTPEKPRRMDSWKVLAYDTPEEDYGLTVRQRIIKKYKTRKRLK